MSLSKDGMTGHPTEKDPNPGERRDVIRGFNRWPNAKNTEGGTRTVSDERRQQISQRNRERARVKARIKMLLTVYEVPRPALVPGEKKELFSRYCKEHDCSTVKFTDIEAFATHVVEEHGSPDKDKKLAEMDDSLEKDLEESLAAETLDALEIMPGGGRAAGEVAHPVHVPQFDVIPEE